MNYFPHPSPLSPARAAVKALAPVRQALTRDVLWNRPLFKAPDLPPASIAPGDLPFPAPTLARIPVRRD